MRLNCRWLAVTATTVILLGLEFAQLGDELRYERSGLAAGEWWRLFSGHFVHLGPSHVALNIAGLLAVMLLVGHRLRIGEWIAATLAATPTVSAGLWLGAPEVEWYVGLSGVLHTWITMGALALWTQDDSERLISAIIAIVLASKLTWEFTLGPLPGSTALSGGPVVHEAHLFGTLAGVGLYALRPLAKSMVRYVWGCLRTATTYRRQSDR